MPREDHIKGREQIPCTLWQKVLGIDQCNERLWVAASLWLGSQVTNWYDTRDLEIVACWDWIFRWLLRHPAEWEVGQYFRWYLHLNRCYP